MPIDHDARLPIPRMPFGEEILVPRAEVARVRSARRDVFAPELGEPRLKEPIDDRCNTLSHGFRSDKATPDVEEIFVREPLVPHVDAVQPCPGSKPIQREEEPVLEGGPVEVFPRRRTAEEPRKVHTAVGLLEDMQETRHRPSRAERRVECAAT